MKNRARVIKKYVSSFGMLVVRNHLDYRAKTNPLAIITTVGPILFLSPLMRVGGDDWLARRIFYSLRLMAITRASPNHRIMGVTMFLVRALGHFKG
jgi:hypothetical protein